MRPFWYLTASSNLSSDALRAIQDSLAAADPVYLPSICIVEVIFLVEKKRIPAEALERLLAALADADSMLRIAIPERKVVPVADPSIQLRQKLIVVIGP